MVEEEDHTWRKLGSRTVLDGNQLKFSVPMKKTAENGAVFSTARTANPRAPGRFNVYIAARARRSRLSLHFRKSSLPPIRTPQTREGEFSLCTSVELNLSLRQSCLGGSVGAVIVFLDMPLAPRRHLWAFRKMEMSSVCGSPIQSHMVQLGRTR